MEGVGSRLSRTSSRYSGPSATAVFSGRVRKWKKKWVRVSTSSVGVFRASKSNGRNNNNSNSPHHLLLHKWTPLTTATVTASDANGSGETEEPPKRRFRYAPIAMLEHREKVVSKDSEIEETEEFDTESPLPKAVELDMNITDSDQTKEAKTGNLNLGLCLNSEGTDE
ncbi:hypothetical protein ARALYDRAFT_331859 [Arabidopsis lyrata subsp. lyrata]|uniref:Uncharacterized protein n=1 Tax=Arabidopsis lyrata subsp. lyrata TaxID=81972 RepID=D7MV13_ARALL|nr:uncharacterized protein LOC9300460 [Arabidopsis lyrata subsp. lyrata]EFH42341.1 hypothetical protein ARALYDRAFT_331859 [Arabidopsis lyrata subsp. lyrata]|eukprot:XP_002866082.1 uncharacterized protein LOC9300460 [Arabidopsis lyrata subsp. lyrata]